MNSKRLARGATLIEAMVSMVVLTVGFLAMAASNYVSADNNNAAGKLAFATGLGRDLLAAATRWPDFDSRLFNVNTSNDSVVFEGGKSSGLPAFDKRFDDGGGMVSGLAPGDPIPSARLDFNGDGVPDFRRYLIIRPLLDGSGTPVGKHLTAVVQWFDGTGDRVVTLHSVKYGNALKPTPGL